MANYAFLAGFEPIDRVLVPGTAPELEAKFHVPLFWLAMFEAADLRDEPITGVRYGKDLEKIFVVEPPCLVTDAATAMARLKKRTPALATLITPTYRKLLTDFTAFARRLKPQLMVRMSDLASMGDHADFVARMRAALELATKLDDPAALPETYLLEPLTQVSLDATWKESGSPEGLLSGWGWQVSPEERAKRASERKWQKVVAGRSESELVPYMASASFKADDLITHATLGAGVVLRTMDGSKIEVLFKDGARTLVHGRSGQERPRAPDPIRREPVRAVAESEEKEEQAETPAPSSSDLEPA